ncbi:acyl-CoA thioesterase [Sediminivirga luteola]|uniref:acyl-CoA thioesterase n=1 Tax=Sediminivirga luteola TaxID=1774748 RepID=UPI00166A8883|nr:acyl-CoA thioesterase [Sediminivirga luteola]
MASESFRVPLRWRDLDNQGHVYHAEYLTLFDQARTAWLHSSLGVRNPDEYVIARIEIDYLDELVVEIAGPPAVDVSFTIEKLGNKSVTTRETMTRPDGTQVATASTVLLMWDRDTRRTRRLSTEERSLIIPYLSSVRSEP